jgi:transcriptional regulator with XRE-family HTH domain
VTPERLCDFVRRIRREKNLSLSEVSDRSARYGNRISASYVNRIENDPKRRITSDRLKALAYGLDVPMDELLVYVVGITRRDEAEERCLLARFRNLSAERKADVLRIMDCLRDN